MDDNLILLLRQYLQALDRFEMYRVFALRQQLRKYAENQPIGPMLSLEKSATTLAETESDAAVCVRIHP